MILAGVDNITNFYLGNLKNMDIFNIAKLTEMITDSCFCYGMHDFVSRHLPHAPARSILQYKYVHEGNDMFVSRSILIVLLYFVSTNMSAYMIFPLIFQESIRWRTQVKEYLKVHMALRTATKQFINFNHFLI